MAIHKASNQIGKLYKGSNQIGKVYKGSTLIYTAEEKLADISAGTAGSPPTTDSPRSWTSTNYWVLTDYDKLTMTVTNDMKCWDWVSGWNHTKSVETHLVFADGTTLSLGTSASDDKTVDLTKYSNEQKKKVYLKGTVYFSIDDVTNKAFGGSAKATNVIAS